MAVHIRADKRRRLFAAAAGGLALTGCARPLSVLARLGLPVPLHIRIIGIPSAQAAALISALEACRRIYAQARRGDVTVRVTTGLVPDDKWYWCVPPPQPPRGCPPSWLPSSLAKLPSEALTLSGAAQNAGQLGSGQTTGTGEGIPALLIRGRTGLDVKFGTGSLSEPLISPIATDWPDIILAFDMWQYWLASLAADLEEPWKTIADDRADLPRHFDRFGRYYAPRTGTFLAAFPVLRNPMVIANFSPVAPWSWSQLASALQQPAPPGFLIASGFEPSDLYPQPTELGASVVAAFGGGLGRPSSNTIVPTFASSAGLQGFTALADIVSVSPAVDARPYPIGPTYMWNPFGGVQAAYEVKGGVVPLPRGPARRAVPCMYFCATVVSLARRVAAATDFASFLMNPLSQAQLAQWNVALPLRATQAGPVVPVIRSGAPALSDAFAALLVNTDDDLRATDLFGGEKTTANAVSYDRAADAFGGALAAVLGRRGSTADMKAVLERWATP